MNLVKNEGRCGAGGRLVAAIFLFLWGKFMKFEGLILLEALVKGFNFKKTIPFVLLSSSHLVSPPPYLESD